MMASSWVAKGIARAKLTLFCHVVGRNKLGIHLLQSMNIFLDLCDKIEIVENKSTEGVQVLFSGRDFDLIDVHENSISKSVDFLSDEFGMDFSGLISIDKRIPVCSGVGGSSSAAGSIIRMLSSKFNLDISGKLSLFSKIGDDIPMSFYQLHNIVYNDGEKNLFHKIEIRKPLFFLIIKPCVNYTTKEVFNVYREMGLGFEKSLSYTDLLSADIKILSDCRKNSLQPAMSFLSADIPAIITQLSNCDGCLFARMSGAGPSCFGVFDDKERALYAKLQLTKSFPHYWLCICSSS